MHRYFHRSLRHASLALFAFSVCLSHGQAARAATFTVDRTDDDAAAMACNAAAPNDCSLRGAILAANALSEASTVNVPAGTYVLSQSSPCTYKHQGSSASFTTSEVPLCVAKNNVTIQGASAATTIIDGNQAHRVFFISADATLQLSSVTIAHGLGDRSFDLNPYGGGLVNEGTLTLTDSVVRNNSVPAGAVNGGGIYNTGVLTLRRSAVTSNIATSGGGGGIYSIVALLTVIDSTISNNTTDPGGPGGGILSTNGIATIIGSTISGNTANALGGGIFNGGGNFVGRLTVVNSTISGNTSLSSGGGIFTGGITETHLNNVTITNNTSTGFGGGNSGSAGGVSNGGALTLQNTIIAGNRALGPFPTAFDCGGALTSQGYNLIQNTAGCLMGGDTTGNITGQDPQLGLLLDNGGLTTTHALAESSPAIDAGNPSGSGSGGFACSAIDQRGFLRPLGTICDIGAFENGGALSLAKVLPNTGGNTGSVAVFVSGDGFVNGATVKLTRAGHADIVGNPVQVDVKGSAIAATFDLLGRSIGLWDVVVINPDGTSKTQAAGFAIEEGRAPELWVDILGQSVARPAGSVQFFILFGNLGNVDALGVPLVLVSRPGNVAFSLRFPIVPPPPHAGQVPTDWSHKPIIAIPDAGPDSTVIPLLLPVVPAGFTGALILTLTAPAGLAVGQTFQLGVGLGLPHFRPDLDTQVLNAFTEEARAYAQQVLGVEIPPALVPELAQYVTAQFRSVVERGRIALVENLGVQGGASSQAHLLIDAAQFAAARASASAQSSPPQLQYSQTRQVPAQVTGWMPPVSRPITSFFHLIASFFQVSQAEATTVKECEIFFGLSTGLCGYVKIVGSSDPNDKVGSTGAGAAQFLAGAEPLRYAVFFENVETATAPAQEVIITDQLDGSKVDFDTLSLGPISFGDRTVVPPPGLSQYSTSVDLRPVQDLVVGIDARLDKSTGLITWRFTSIDPLTGQFTEDPLAGFLPPNVNPPEGDGSVVFTIKPKVTGTPICNQASIVFDVNAPILTPQWCNTIDATPPSSAVQSLSATQVTTDFPVQWAGSDTGAGIADYTIFVSENGGPFSPFVSDTTDTSATFTGQTGKTYAFYSVARDLVGNVEAPPPGPDTQTIVGGLDQCPNDPSKTAPGLCGCGVPDTDSDGDGTPDCQDQCPNDASKIQIGACGCGTSESVVGQSCTTGQPGVCSAGTKVCAGGALSCRQNQQPAAEVCDGQDNNCNGTVDDGFNVGSSCTVGVGTCQRTGSSVCAANGQAQCNATPGTPSVEICGNGIDEDCNGTDLACPPPPSGDSCTITTVLDTFNRADGNIGTNWRGTTDTAFYRIAGNRLDVQVGGPIFWNPAAFGTNQAAFVTLSAVDTKGPSQGVLLKVQSGTVPNAGAISVVYDATAKAVRVSTLRLGTLSWTSYGNTAVLFANGDKLGACAKANGEVRVYKNDALVKTVTLSAADQGFFNAKGGKVGVWSVLAPQAFLDNFGGATIVP